VLTVEYSVCSDMLAARTLEFVARIFSGSYILGAIILFAFMYVSKILG